MKCPLCKSELSIRIDAFTCATALDGCYLKGRVALTCGWKTDKPCAYMHTTNFKTSSAPAIAKLTAIAGELIRKLPDFGPWETFALSDKERKPHRAYKRRTK